jgi:hypothetical protein
MVGVVGVRKCSEFGAASVPRNVQGGFASGRAVLVRDAHRQLRWLAIPAPARRGRVTLWHFLAPPGTTGPNQVFRIASQYP